MKIDRNNPEYKIAYESGYAAGYDKARTKTADAYAPFQDFCYLIIERLTHENHFDMPSDIEKQIFTWLSERNSNVRLVQKNAKEKLEELFNTIFTK